MVLGSIFYREDAAEVAEDLIGKLMIRETSSGITSGYIVETEAYYGEDDPASRAAQNGRTQLTEPMWSEPGNVFVYMVHGHWMLNVITGREEEPNAVLFRALKPVQGTDLMKERREKDGLTDLCSGPGKLTQAMEIDDSFNGEEFSERDKLYIEKNDLGEIDVERSGRIGVTEDLQEPLRFFIEGNEFVSR